MQVTFKRQNSDEEEIQEISPDLKLGEIRQAVQTLFGFPEHQPCQLILQRTNKPLDDSLTFQQAGIQNNDKLLLSSLSSREPDIDTKGTVGPQTYSQTKEEELKVVNGTSADTHQKVQGTNSKIISSDELQKKIIFGSVITGSVIGIFILLNSVLIKLPGPTIENSDLILPPPGEEQSISRQQAVNLIQRYLEAKKQMFAPPYNRQVAYQLGTDKFYKDAVGTIDWLQSTGSYYQYGIQKIESIENFSIEGNTATFKVKITEDYTLYNQKGIIDGENSNFKTLTVVYNIKLVDGTWKIFSSKLVE